MSIKIVLGAGFGDEGKGKVTSGLAALHPSSSLVIRFNGGHQAGHTVKTNGISHVFASFGSGSLHGVSTYLMDTCIISPIAIRNEYQVLLPKSPNVHLIIDPMAVVSTPFDTMHNRIGAEDNLKHGSCGVGINSTLIRHVDNNLRLYAIDLLTPSVYEAKLDQIIKSYEYLELDSGNIEILKQEFLDSVEFLMDSAAITIAHPLKTYKGKPFTCDFEHLIFEGAQGIMLDQEHGFFPHVTRSYTTCRNVSRALKNGKLEHLLPKTIEPPTIYYVTRGYLTRHGAGPLPGEIDKLDIDNTGETNVTNKYQQKLRYAPLDISLTHHAIRCNRMYAPHHYQQLVINCVDQMRDKDEIKRVTDLASWSPLGFDIDDIITGIGPLSSDFK